MRRLHNRMNQIEKALDSGGTPTTDDFIRQRVELIKDYLLDGEPVEPITQDELDEFDPMLKSLYEKYMTEYIKGD